MSINIVDIVCLVFLGYALYRGFKNGILIEVGSVLALLAGVWCAFKYGEKVGLWLGLESTTASVVGFILMLIAVVLFIMVACRLMRMVLSMVGLRLFDRVGGGAVSVAKTAIVLSLLLGFIVPLNDSKRWVEPNKFKNSKAAQLLIPLSDQLFPYAEQAKQSYLESLEVEE